MDKASSPDAARERIRSIVATGTVTFTRHALEELAKDRMTTVDATNVLQGGAVTLDTQTARGEWTYHVRTAQMTVVVTLASNRELRVITAWRHSR